MNKLKLLLFIFYQRKALQTAVGANSRRRGFTQPRQRLQTLSAVELGTTKKLIRKSDELLIFFDEVFKAFNLTYLSRCFDKLSMTRDGIGTFAFVILSLSKDNKR